MLTTTLDPPMTPKVTISLPITPLPDDWLEEEKDIPPIIGTVVQVQTLCYRCPGKATTECDRCGKPLCSDCYTVDIGPCQIERRMCGPCITIKDRERGDRLARYLREVERMHSLYPQPFLPRAVR